jgi:hypothetical protein
MSAFPKDVPVFIPATPDPRETKLPVWAQEKLTAERRTVEQLREELALLRGDLPESNVRVMGKPGICNSVALPPNSSVKFDNKWGGIVVYHDQKGRIQIQGDNTLIVRLGAGNSLSVELEAD